MWGGLMEYFKGRIVRLVPLFALVLFVICLGPGKVEQFPTWGRLGIVLFIVLSIVLPALFLRPSKAQPATSKYAVAIQSHVRTIWRVLLWLYICSFVGGLLTIAIIRPAIPLIYAVLPLGVNLILVVLFWRLLSSRTSGKF
jgi:hypothetical protein